MMGQDPKQDDAPLPIYEAPAIEVLDKVEDLTNNGLSVFEGPTD